jgi:aspartate/methionine/tyrosine aminotransferase
LPLSSKNEFILMSLSKSHNLADLRCGWIVSSVRIPHLIILKCDYSYISRVTGYALEAASLYDPKYLYHKYDDRFRSLYKKHSLIQTDTNLFALHPETKQKVMWYELDAS